MKQIANKILDLYMSKDGGGGGYGHIIFDDGNVENNHIEWCLDQAKRATHKFLCEDTRKKSIIAIKAMMPLTEKERLEAIDLFDELHYEKVYKK